MRPLPLFTVIGLLSLLSATSAASDNALAEGQQAFQHGDIKAAERAFSRAIQNDPQSHLARIAWTRLELRLGRLAVATESTDKLLKLGGIPAVHTLNGDLKLRLGDFAAAENEYREALKLDTQDAQAWFGLGRLATFASMHKRAARYYERAHELSPTDYEIAHRWAQSQRTFAERLSAYESLQPELKKAGTRTDISENTISLLRALAGQKPFALASQYTSADLRLTPILAGAELFRGWALKVSINKSKPLLLLLDTGTSGIVLNKRAAQNLNLRRIADFTARGLGQRGDVHGFTAIAETITVGEARFNNCLVDVSTGPPVKDVDGLIGADVFADFLITVDFNQARLLLRPYSDAPTNDLTDRRLVPANEVDVPVWRSEHLLLVPVKVNSQGPYLFALDTGADTSSISTALARSGNHVVKDSQFAYRGLSGYVKEVGKADQVTLEFAGFRQSGDGMLALDLTAISQAAGTEVSGILGMNTLSSLSVTIDYRNGLLRLEAR